MDIKHQLVHFSRAFCPLCVCVCVCSYRCADVHECDREVDTLSFWVYGSSSDPPFLATERTPNEWMNSISLCECVCTLARECVCAVIWRSLSEEHMWEFSVELERVCELLHMVVGECEIRGKVGNTVLLCVCVCVCVCAITRVVCLWFATLCRC